MAETKELPAPDKEDDELKGSEAPLLDHLIELRKRLVRSVLALAVAFGVCFYFADPIFELLVRPLAGMIAMTGSGLPLRDRPRFEPRGEPLLAALPTLPRPSRKAEHLARDSDPLQPASLATNSAALAGNAATKHSTRSDFR